MRACNLLQVWPQQTWGRTKLKPYGPARCRAVWGCALHCGLCAAVPCCAVRLTCCGLSVALPLPRGCLACPAGHPPPRRPKPAMARTKMAGATAGQGGGQQPSVAGGWVCRTRRTRSSSGLANSRTHMHTHTRTHTHTHMHTYTNMHAYIHTNARKQRGMLGAGKGPESAATTLPLCPRPTEGQCGALAMHPFLLVPTTPSTLR